MFYNYKYRTMAHDVSKCSCVILELLQNESNDICSFECFIDFLSNIVEFLEKTITFLHLEIMKTQFKTI